jgi:Holliday junction resolvase RusA-like endonuclease
MTQPIVTQLLAQVHVSGHPKTKGSLEFVTAKHAREKPGSDRWRKLVADALKRGRIGDQGVPFPGRVGVSIVSYLQPPLSYRERIVEWLLGRFSGDGDKLTRNVLDALTDSGLIVDDGQVWDLYHGKRLAPIGALPGQVIQVWVVPEDAPWT